MKLCRGAADLPALSAVPYWDQDVEVYRGEGLYHGGQ